MVIFFLILVALAAGACGDGDPAPPVALPLVAEIEPAITAVEAELGAPQQYFEINATPQLVNLIVATDGAAKATTYLYLDGELQPPAPPQDAQGATFAAEAVDFDPDTVFATLAAELDQPAVSSFVVVGGPGGAVQYSAFVASEAGGVLHVILGPDGAVLGVDPG